MKRYQIDDQSYQKVLNKIEKALENESQIVFAYLHGSFLQKTNFGDIDLAIYLQGISEQYFLKYEASLERSLEESISLPVDVRVLNTAPLAFRYSAIKNGLQLINKDHNKRVDFETMTFKLYFDFQPFRKRYLEEALNHEV